MSDRPIAFCVVCNTFVHSRARGACYCRGFMTPVFLSDNPRRSAD